MLAVQEPAVQCGAGQSQLLRDGEPVLSVGGGLPQGLSGERGQTPVAQRLDAGQVSADTLASRQLSYRTVFNVLHQRLCVEGLERERRHQAVAAFLSLRDFQASPLG